MTLYKWSQTASADATADSTINWAEGQSPSSVNDSARAMMAAIAKYRDDIAGAIVTTGTSTAYSVNSYQVFQSLAQLNGQLIAFTPHATNGATVTINVDSLGAKPLRAQPNVELPSGTLIQGTPYAALYNNSDGAFYLFGVGPNPGVPLGSILDYAGSTAPSSAFAFAYGQAISRTTYASLFSLLGTTYGSGDGSTTFNVPDLRSRVVAGKDDMGGSGSFRLTTANFGSNPQVLGAAGGSEAKSLVTANLPPYTPSGTIGGTGTSSQNVQVGGGSHIAVATGAGGSVPASNDGSPITVPGSTYTFTGSPQGGTSTAFAITQPTIILCKILRII